MKWKSTLLFFMGIICLCNHADLAQVASPPPLGAVAPGTGSISGRVLVQGKPVARVRLALQRGPFSSMVASSSARSESDAEGRYKFSGLAAGSYTISPLSSVYIWGTGMPGDAANTVTLGDGEQETEVDLSLKRGGVVTGKITDADGNPVVARFVQIERVDGLRGLPPIGVMLPVDFTTDDRGVYRYYGVHPGKYRVSCGDGEGSYRQGSQGKTYPRTFFPDVADQAMAAIIEVGEGSEVTGVDIRLGSATKTYSIAGRAVDADTNEPVAGVVITLDMPAGDGRSQQFGGRSNAGSSGEFVLTSVRPGRWRVSADSGYPPQGADTKGYSDPIFVEVREENVTGVEVRVKRGGSISGVAVIEGETNIPNAPRLLDQQVMVFVDPEGDRFVSSTARVQLAANGTFRVDGLRPGRASFMQIRVPNAIALAVIRTERDGQVMPVGIQVGPGENVTGVRLVFAYASANIIGQVVVTGGALPPGVTLAVTARPVGGGMMSSGSTRVDAKGNFAIERLVPGQYEVEVRPMSPQNPQTAVSGTGTKQTISLATGETAKVALTFALKE